MPVAKRQRLLIVHNPCAGAGSRRRLRRVIAALQRLGAEPMLRTTATAGEAWAIAADLRAIDWDAVIVAGGDGTINEVVNGLAANREACARGSAKVPLGVIPLGTANVLAAELGLPTAPAALAALLADGPVQDIGLPRVNDRLAVMMVGIGFDAFVCGRVDASLKRRLGRAAYWLALPGAFAHFGRRGYRVNIDGVDHEAASVVIANGHYYGGRYTCAPEARLSAPDIHVCLFFRTGARAFIGYAWALLCGRLYRHPDVCIRPGRVIAVAGSGGAPASGGESVQVDGDLAVRLPVVVAADAVRLSVIAPPPRC